MDGQCVGMGGHLDAGIDFVDSRCTRRYLRLMKARCGSISPTGQLAPSIPRAGLAPAAFATLAALLLIAPLGCRREPKVTPVPQRAVDIDEQAMAAEEADEAESDDSDVLTDIHGDKPPSPFLPDPPPWPMSGTPIIGNDQIGESVVADIKKICAELSKPRVDFNETVQMMGTLQHDSDMSADVLPRSPLYSGVVVDKDDHLVKGEAEAVMLELRNQKALTTKLLKRHFLVRLATQGLHPFGTPTSFSFSIDDPKTGQRQCQLWATTWLMPGTAAVAQSAALRALRKEPKQRRLKGLPLYMEANRRGAMAIDAWVHRVIVRRWIYPDPLPQYESP